MKKDAIIVRAKELFSKYGVKRVTIDEICKRAKCSKMTFYRYFKNRTDIAKFILSERYKEAINRIRAIFLSEASIEDKLKDVLIFKMDYMGPGGDEMIRGLMEIEDPELESFFKNEDKIYKEELKKLFVEVQGKGEIRDDIKIELVIYMFNTMKGIIGSQELGEIYPNHGALVKDVLTLFYYGIFGYSND